MRTGVEAWYRDEHVGRPQILSTNEDVDGMIDSLLREPCGKNLAQLHSVQREILPSGSPDHILFVGVDPNLQVGMVSFCDSAGTVNSCGNLNAIGSVRYFIGGHDLEFPASCEIPIPLVRQAAKEFLNSGGVRPASIDLQKAVFRWE